MNLSTLLLWFVVGVIATVLANNPFPVILCTVLGFLFSFKEWRIW